MNQITGFSFEEVPLLNLLSFIQSAVFFTVREDYTVIGRLHSLPT